MKSASAATIQLWWHDRRVAPAFLQEERQYIAEWQEEAAEHDIVAYFDASYDFLMEALSVSQGSRGGLRWLVHKTPEGAFAVRLWPGIASIVPTLPEALAKITAAVRQ